MGTTFAALRERDFRIWSLAGFLSTIGSWMQTLAINWYTLQATGSAGKMGLTLLLQALPVLLLSSWAGALADRVPAKPVLISTQLAHALLAAVLAATIWGHLGGLPVIYLVSVLSGVVAAVEGPVMGRFTSTIVKPESLGNALAVGSLSNSAARILGMSAGGVMVSLTGPAPLFAGNAMSFLAVIGALLVIRAATVRPGDVDRAAAGRREAPAGRGVLAGLRYLAGQPVVLITLALAAVLGSLGRNYQVTMAAMSDGPLHAGARGYGLLSTVFAIGTVLGALAAARRARLGYRILVGTGLVTSVLQLAGGVFGGLWTFAGVLLPIAAGAVIIDTTVSTRVQLDTRPEMRGRVLAALSVTGSLAGSLGAPVLGWLSGALGPRHTLVLAGTVTVLASAVAGIALARHLRPAAVAADPLAAAAVLVAHDAKVPRPRAVWRDEATPDRAAEPVESLVPHLQPVPAPVGTP
jgi:MFS family permease